MKIVRRVGASPRERGSATGETCPDIFELDNGDFAVIGREATAQLDPELPSDAARADSERIFAAVAHERRQLAALVGGLDEAALAYRRRPIRCYRARHRSGPSSC